jgi:hypothetical protein
VQASPPNSLEPGERLPKRERGRFGHPFQYFSPRHADSVMKICTVIGQSSDIYLRSTRTNEIPARAQLHTSVDRQTAAQMQNRSSMYTEQQSHFPRMRAGYSTVGGICTEWHGWICLEDKGESVRAQQTEAGKVIFRAMWE